MRRPFPSTDLRTLFAPRSVAVIGASADSRSISARPLRMLQQHGYAGGIYPVNPKYVDLSGLPVYPTIGAVPTRVDLALIVVPASVVAGVLEECVSAGVQSAIVITSGFAESGGTGRQLQTSIADVVARSEGTLRVGGPNSEGVYNPSARLCATFSPAVDPEHGFVPREAGPVAVISQSGGLAFALMTNALDRGVGVGAVVSTGNEVDLGWAEYADYLLDQPDVRVILGFVEAFRHPRRLVEVAHKAARLKKPIVLAKIGRSEAGRRAAASHTGSLVGADAAYSAVLRQVGIIRVDDIDEMLDLAAYFSVGRLPAGRRVAVLTASGGAGAWLADACAARGLDLPGLDSAAESELRSFIPAYGSVANPVDITAQAVLEGGFERALGILCNSKSFDAVLPVATLVREERFFQTLPELDDAIARTPASVAFYSYTRASPAIIAALAGLGIPCFSTPGRTAQALTAAVAYAEFLRGLEQIAIFDPAPENCFAWSAPDAALSESGARAYLAPLGLAAPEARLAHTADEAVAVFHAFGDQPVALKIQSPDLPHKADVGGVRLQVRTPDDVRAEFEEIVQGIGRTRPDARIEGVLVQRMAPAGIEAFVAARREPLLGPLVVVGVGGVNVETLGDVAIRLAPVSIAEAHGMLNELRGSAMLRGARSRPPADAEALARAVVQVSQLAAALPGGVRTVEINPLLVLPLGQGVLMLDAAVELEAAELEDERI